MLSFQAHELWMNIVCYYSSEILSKGLFFYVKNFDLQNLFSFIYPMHNLQVRFCIILTCWKIWLFFVLPLFFLYSLFFLYYFFGGDFYPYHAYILVGWVNSLVLKLFKYHHEHFYLRLCKLWKREHPSMPGVSHQEMLISSKVCPPLKWSSNILQHCQFS